MSSAESRGERAGSIPTELAGREERVLEWMVRHRVAVTVGVVVLHVAIAALLGRFQAPIAGDENDYMMGAARLWDGRPYYWGFRPPLVSLLFAPAALLDGSTSLAVARLFSLVVGSSSVAWWLRASALSRRDRATVPAMTALLSALWPPFFLFSSRALGEGLALFATSGVFATSYLLVHGASDRHRPTRAMLIGCLLAMAVLSKANLGLLAVTWAGWVLLSPTGAVWHRWRTVLVAAAMAAALYTPWGGFQLAVNQTIVPTTSGGMNLAVGSGAYGFGMDSETESLVARFRRHAAWDTSECNGDAELCARIVAATHPSEVQTEAAALARAHVRADPLRSAMFVLVKWGHMVGLSLRGISDYVLLGFGILGGLAAWVAWRSDERAVVGLLACGYVSALVTGAFFLPNIRFRVPVIDPVNLLLFAVALDSMGRRLLHRRLPVSTDPTRSGMWSTPGRH